MSNGGGDLLRMYLCNFALNNTFELEEFLEYYNTMERRITGFAFNVARRCLSIAIVNTPLSVDRCLQSISSFQALPECMVNLLRLWVNTGVDKHGHRLDHLFLDEHRFNIMLQKELIRLDQEELKRVKMGCSCICALSDNKIFDQHNEL